MQCHLVDPNPDRLDRLRQSIGDAIDVETFSDFQTARERLLKTPPHMLATNLRLGPYNGLHLVHLAAAETGTRCVVFGDHTDPGLVQEAQRAGAFYEDASRVARALPSYMNATLPERDRRTPLTIDRRGPCRGSRRAADSAGTAIGTSSTP